MAIVCPYCRHSMTVKDAKPGKYKPKCAKCGKRFGLTVGSDPSEPPLVAALIDEAPAPSAPPSDDPAGTARSISAPAPKTPAASTAAGQPPEKSEQSTVAEATL